MLLSKRNGFSGGICLDVIFFFVYLSVFYLYMYTYAYLKEKWIWMVLTENKLQQQTRLHASSTFQHTGFGPDLRIVAFCLDVPKSLLEQGNQPKPENTPPLG